VLLAGLCLCSRARACTYRAPKRKADVSIERTPLARSASEGFVTNALNPSLATFYLLVIPAFVPREAPFASSALLLTAIHVSLAITWPLSWAAAGGTLSETLARTRPRRILEAISGVALLALARKPGIRKLRNRPLRPQ